ncbi:helix-turn-helix transcriptional regulator [Streptomonospora sediminis]
MYRERASVAGGVVWAGAAAQHRRVRVVPDGCMDLIWTGEHVLVAGPDTAAHFAEWAPERTLVGLRLPPAVGPAVLGIPAHEVRDLRVALADVWPAAQARRLGEQAAAAADPAGPLERAAAVRLGEGPGTDPAMAAVAALLDSGATVARAAEQTGLGARRLYRRSLAAYGYGPKTLGRILRFNRALAAAREGVPFAETAAATGYADQAHLAREVKGLAGAPLSVLVG